MANPEVITGVRYRRSICLFFLITAIPALHRDIAAQWKLVSTNLYSSFDMLDTRVGLAGQFGVGLPTLCRYDNGAITGIFTASGLISNIVILDTNVAFFSVFGDGIYEASLHWSQFTKVHDADTSTVLTVLGRTVVVNIHRSLAVSSDGGNTFGFSKGILARDSVCAVGIYDSSTMIAVADSDLYRSVDGGAHWSLVLDTIRRTHSIYIDRAHKYIYVGGVNLMRSSDGGANWVELRSIFFGSLSGPVVGVNDCTGVLYLGPDNVYRGELLRSVNLGKFFQSVGQANFAQTHLNKGIALDRGSTFFWLDSGGVMSMTTVGVDGTITDSVADHVIVGIDTVLHNSLCANTPASTYTFRVRYDQCTGIVLDSLLQVSANPAFKVQFLPKFLGDTEIKFSFSFRARAEGPDSVRYRLKFHSPITGNYEQIFFTIPGVGDASSAVVSFSVPEVDFGKIGIDSARRKIFSILNTGCDTLIITSVTSSNIVSFQIAAKQYPIVLLPGQSVSLTVTFLPSAEGDYLESAVIATNIGTRYLTLRGTGTIGGGGDTSLVVMQRELVTVSIFPNPARDILYLEVSETIPISQIEIIDELGRVIRPAVINESGERIALDIHTLPAGSYLLSGGDSIRKRFIKF
ncbi:MAG TPA: T9SS type A sorting domain-containing protein [Candidatus Kapabacteria bacterium]|nr:T9SS type A sorting domain-containing protein [Candidatus Kapabacteria bacterium]